MSSTTSQPADLGAEMDYPEHEKTYHVFLSLAKYSILITISLLISMAVGFFSGAGFFTAFIVFIVLLAISFYFLR